MSTLVVDTLKSTDGVATIPVKSINTSAASVLNYGADATGVEDSSAAFVAAFEENSAVYVPEGTYIASFSIPSGKSLKGAGMGKSIIKTALATTTKQITLTSVSNVSISDVTFDGTATSVLSYYYGLVHIVTSTGVELVNVETTGSGNAGIVFVDCDNFSSATSSKVESCYVHDNQWEGIICLGANTSISFYDNRVIANAHHGVVFKPSAYPFTAGACHSIKFNGNTVASNTGHGIFNAGLWSPTMTGDGDLDISYMVNTSANNQFMQNSQFNQNVVESNVATGMVLGGSWNTVNSNAVRNNGLVPSSGGFSGIVLCGYGMTCNDNVCTGNRTYGIDLGGAQSSTANGNSISYNAVDEAFCIGLNIGASSNCVVHNNTVIYNGTDVSTSYQVVVSGIDGDGVAAYPAIGTISSVSGNTVIGTSNQIGIRVHNMASFIKVKDNMLSGFSANNAIQIRVAQTSYGPCDVSGNRLDSTMLAGPSVASASTLVIPDMADYVYITGTTAITALQTYSQNSLSGGVTGVVMTNAGSGYDPSDKPTVTLSGGSGAVVSAEVTRAGTIKGITASTAGSGYTTGSTVTFSAPSSGTTATGTLVAGALNNAGKVVTLFFESALTISVSGMNNSFTAQSGSTLTLRGVGNGTWAEVSRAS